LYGRVKRNKSRAYSIIDLEGVDGSKRLKERERKRKASRACTYIAMPVKCTQP
jgi:hypothetical protein